MRRMLDILRHPPRKALLFAANPGLDVAHRIDGHHRAERVLNRNLYLPPSIRRRNRFDSKIPQERTRRHTHRPTILVRPPSIIIPRRTYSTPSTQLTHRAPPTNERPSDKRRTNISRTNGRFRCCCRRKARRC